MKTLKLLTIIIALFSTTSLVSQTPNFNHNIAINQTFTSDAVLYPFNGSAVTGIGASGSITLNSDTSLVRIVVSDNLTQEYLVYETYTIIEQNPTFTFSLECDETCFLDDYFASDVIIYIRDASLTLNSIHWSDNQYQNILTLQEQAKYLKNSEKVNEFNTYISQNNLIWIAGETNQSKWYYSAKSQIWGEKYNSYGHEFYSSGIYSIKSPDGFTDPHYGFVDNFDWRNRHGANNLDLANPYYDGYPNGSGWLTTPVCQSGCWDVDEILCNIPASYCENTIGGEYRETSLCWAFGPIAQMEGVTNLYFNQHYNVDISEQYVSCFAENNPTIGRGDADNTFALFTNGGIVDEASLPFCACITDCNVAPNPLETISFSTIVHNTNPTIDEVKQYLFETGPLTSEFFDPHGNGEWSHTASIVGWGTIDESLEGLSGFPIIHESWYGVTYWIYQESAGSGLYHNGFKYIVHWENDQPHVYSLNSSINSTVLDDSDIQCLDVDDDGYFFWGIGDKPIQCPPCPDEPDGDDTNPSLGPLDSNGFCTIIDTYNSSFENDWNNWKQVGYDDCDWWRHSGPTETPGTGPDQAQDGDYYIYTPSGINGCGTGAKFTIESPPVNIESQCGIFINFHYHFNVYTGGGTTEMLLETSEDNGVTWKEVWAVSDNQGTEWLEMNKIVPNTVNKFRFVLEKGPLNQSDVAIDNITIGPASKGSPIHISSNTVWDYEQDISSDIFIEENATLTIENCKISMLDDCRIIVEPQGDLVLDGAILTNACNELWQGVQVWGDESSPYPNDQGRLYMHGESMIANAKVAVMNYQPTIPLNFNHRGGIVEITNSSFENNETTFLLREINHNCWIHACDFLINNDYLEDEFDTFINLISFEDMSISDCTFENDNNDFVGYGVKATNSSFVINGDETRFESLLYGIYATGIGTTDFSRIKEGYFKKNYRGIYISGINEMEIIDNYFRIPQYDPATMPDEPHGAFLDNCTGYTIEVNLFRSFSSVNKGSVGLYIKDSGPDDNMVYDNWFDDLIYGTIAYGQNKNTFGTQATGLCYKCNTFTDNDYDISIPKGTTIGTGIKATQGSSGINPDDPAGNLFSWTGPLGTPTDIHNQGDQIIYHYHGNYPEYSLEPKYYTKTTPVPSSALWDEEDSCPPSSNGGGGGGIGGGRDALIGQMNEYETEVSNIQATLDVLVDGGDTEATTENVENSYPPESYEVYTDLMNKSPYLSNEVTNAAIEKDNVLPNVMIRDVMVANPQSAKEDGLIDKLEERSEPMPDYMIAQILQGRELVGYLEELNSQKSNFELKRALVLTSFLRLVMEDETLSDEQKIDELIGLFLNENTLSAQYRLAMLFFEKGNFTSGQDIINAIPSHFELDDELITAHNYFNDFYQVMVDLVQSGDELSEVQLTTLLNIEQSEASPTNAFARNLLIAYGEMEYIEQVILPDFSKSAEAEQEYNELMQALEDHHYLKLFPNPATDHVIIDYELEMEYTNATIRLYDSNGISHLTIQANNSKDQAVIDTKNLPAGVYVVSLSINNNEIDSIKFTIIK